MFKDGKWYREYYWLGKYYQEEHLKHVYGWTGKIPCTGQLKCILCGKPKDNQTEDLK